jgi:hypothetical protein
MEPVSLTVGAVVAALVAKAAEAAGEEAAHGAAGAVRRVAAWLRARFSEDADESGVAVLQRLEAAPDSPSRVRALAAYVDDRARRDGAFREELETQVAEAQQAGVDVRGLWQVAVGDQNVQVADVTDSSVSISYGVDRGSPGRDE